MAAPARRPARLPRAVRRGQLLEVARVVFAAQGYAGTSMDEIAERADVSKPVVYQHFGGKQELFLELLDAEVERLRALIVEGIASTQDNRIRARSAVHAVFRYMDSPTSDHRREGGRGRGERAAAGPGGDPGPRRRRVLSRAALRPGVNARRPPGARPLLP